MQFAVHLTTSGGTDDNYYGLHATMDVYGHKLKPGQGSSTAIWITNDGDGVRSSFNGITVGWHVRFFPFDSYITFEFKQFWGNFPYNNHGTQ